MILRRLTEHVRTQNWLAVALDFLIVVVGVFIGIQVSNENDARAGRQLGESYIERLRHDLNKDKVISTNLAVYYATVLESVETTRRLLRDPEADPYLLVINAYRASEIAYVPKTVATWEQIISSGHLGLIPERVLDSGITDYFAFDDNEGSYEAMATSPYRQRVRMIIPADIQLAMRLGCSDLRDNVGIIRGLVPFDQCNIAIDPQQLSQTAEALRSDGELEMLLNLHFSAVTTHRISFVSGTALAEIAITSLGPQPNP
ncbi:MAG: hypothetical protein AAGH41_04040 [Pseudomonadota bacterium]